MWIQLVKPGVCIISLAEFGQEQHVSVTGFKLPTFSMCCPKNYNDIYILKHWKIWYRIGNSVMFRGCRHLDDFFFIYFGLQNQGSLPNDAFVKIQVRGW
jgi:hypothetical protein